MKIKAISAGTILTAAVITPIALTVSASAGAYEDDPYKITIAYPLSFKTLNKFKAASTEDTNSILGIYTSALLRSRPAGQQNGGLETSLSLQKLEFSFGSITDEQREQLHQPGNDTSKSNLVDRLTSNMKQKSYGFKITTTDLAEYVLPLGSVSNSQEVAFQIRKNARFWNGDRVTAEDFINTFKIALNAKNGVPWAWQIYRTMGLKNAKKIWDAQTIDGLSFDDALKKYPLGIIPAGEIPEEEMATTPEGKAYYRGEYQNHRPRHSKVLFMFEGDLSMTFLQTYALNTLGTPTSIRHFNKIGLDDWGTSIDNLMGCGPYKPVWFDLDYKIVANRWDGYWDKGHVISPQIELRVLPDISTEIQMFKKGKIGTVSFGTELLPQFFSDPELKRYVKPTDWAESLTYIGFNTNINNPNAKYLLNDDLRRAIQYSVNRLHYLSMLGADNTFPNESWTTLTFMNDAQGQGPINHSIRFNNDLGFLPSPMSQDGTHIPEWNHLYKTDDSDPMAKNPGGKDEMFTRGESVLTSQDPAKNNKEDNIYNPVLAKAYYDKFKKDNPEFNGVELKWIVPGSKKDHLIVMQQDIERNLPGVKVKIIPKPDLVYKQVLADMNWDMNLDTWRYEYRDPWALYHLLADKISQTDDKDEIVRTRLNRNASSDGLSLVDFIARRISQDPAYFAKRFLNNGDIAHQKVIDGVIAQFLRMEATIGSENPAMNTFQSPVDSTKEISGYEPAIWDTEPSNLNDFNGYKGTFDKYKKIYPNEDPTKWADNLKTFITNNSTKDLWRSKDYRFNILYPTIERLIRDSAVGITISRIQNAFIISRFIGNLNFAERINYFGFIYQANKVPPSNFVLPGKEALGA